ncbi:hypothetical protein ACFE04_020696 [Oxalis oulophora]
MGDLDPFTQMPFQIKDKISSQALDINTGPKASKPENKRKKMDLPVQKNLLTKYFCILLEPASASYCFATLEAKRKFRAPQSSPQPPSPTDDSPCSTLEPKSSSESLLDSGNLDNDTPLDNIESGPASETSEFSESPNYGKSTIESRQPLAKEHDGMNTLDEAKGKIRTDSNKLPVSGNKQGKLSVQNPESFSFRSNSLGVTATLNEKCLANSSFQKPEKSLDVPEGVEGKNRTNNSRRVIVRSSYFKNTQKRESDPENKQTKFIEEDIEISDNVIPTYIPSESESFRGETAKRKASPNSTSDLENVQPKQMRTDASLHDGSWNVDLTEASMETKDDGKFGANISHIGEYTGIAEKSMEKFVSMLSHFKCSSSGSRASGLRAPLKDVRNTKKNRPTVLDISQFSYNPKKGKAALKSRKRPTGKEFSCGSTEVYFSKAALDSY